MKISIGFVATALTLGLFVGMSGGAQAALIGPIVDYESFADSPFNGQSYSYFHLENFEDGFLNTPGVTSSPASVVGPGPLVDSVEGQGDGGRSYFTLDGSGGITFTFNAAILGQLPTDVGIVWTDGDAPNRYFTAFDQNGVSLGTITDGTGLFYSTGGDDTYTNYRFFGATNAGGISSIHISNDSGGIEVDDLQYGAAGERGATVPEPAGWALMIGGLGMAGGVLRRRRAVVSAAAA